MLEGGRYDVRRRMSPLLLFVALVLGITVWVTKLVERRRASAVLGRRAAAEQPVVPRRAVRSVAAPDDPYA